MSRGLPSWWMKLGHKMWLVVIIVILLIVFGGVIG